MDTSEMELRELWTAKGISEERQNELIADVTAKAQLGAKVGPFTIGKMVEPGTPDALAAYHRLDLWGDYLKARQVWQAAHATYAAMAAFHRDKQTAREAMQEAASKREAILAKLRETPEHKAAFGW